MMIAIAQCRAAGAAGGGAEVIPGESAIGGGSLPGETLPTWLVSVAGASMPGGAEGIARGLRGSDPPVLARIEDDRVLIDPRTVLPEEGTDLMRTLETATKQGASDQGLT